MPALSAPSIQRAVQKRVSKVGGLDGLSYDALKTLPVEAYADLVRLMHQAEAELQLPGQWRLQHVSLLPKKPSIERPISLTSVAYI
jgi:hypothetical protein